MSKELTLESALNNYNRKQTTAQERLDAVIRLSRRIAAPNPEKALGFAIVPKDSLDRALIDYVLDSTPRGGPVPARSRNGNKPLLSVALEVDPLVEKLRNEVGDEAVRVEGKKVQVPVETQA